MTLSEKSSLSLSQEEILQQEAIKVLEELAQKQNQASLLRLKLQQSFFYWSALSVLSLVIFLFFGSSLLCTSSLIKNNNYCRDNSLNSILIGLMAAPLCSISFIKAVNKRSSVNKLTDDLAESEINYNQLFNAIYSSRLEKSAKQPSVPQTVITPKLLDLLDFPLPSQEISVIAAKLLDSPPKGRENLSKMLSSISPLRSVPGKPAKETSTNVSFGKTIQ